jgi:hypothetical protein
MPTKKGKFSSFVNVAFCLLPLILLSLKVCAQFEMTHTHKHKKGLKYTLSLVIGCFLQLYLGFKYLNTVVLRLGIKK